MRRDEETTPAGRFLASMGHNWNGKEVLWVDYSTGISLHRVLTDKPSERRLQRLATSTPLDKRISHGCINVRVKFFDSVVIPTFTGTSGIVYVLRTPSRIGTFLHRTTKSTDRRRQYC